MYFRKSDTFGLISFSRSFLLLILGLICAYRSLFLTLVLSIVEIWCLTLYLFRRLGELTLIVPCYFGHSSVNLGYKIAL